jgi:hypothetical protein
VAAQDLNRINAAVRECLSRCFAADNTAVVIREYLKQLRAQGWTEGEIGLVRATVTRFLRQIAGEVDDEPPDEQS